MRPPPRVVQVKQYRHGAPYSQSVPVLIPQIASGYCTAQFLFAVFTQKGGVVTCTGYTGHLWHLPYISWVQEFFTFNTVKINGNVSLTYTLFAKTKLRPAAKHYQPQTPFFSNVNQSPHLQSLLSLARRRQGCQLVLVAEGQIQPNLRPNSITKGQIFQFHNLWLTHPR